MSALFRRTQRSRCFVTRKANYLYRRRISILSYYNKTLRKALLGNRVEEFEGFFTIWLILIFICIYTYHPPLVIENPQKMQLIQNDNYTNQVNNETILSTFGDSTRQVKPQLRFGKNFIPFVILAFTLCILLGEPGCSIPFSKLIRSDDAFVRRIIIFIFMILLNAAYMINCSFINLNDENVNFGWPIISFFTMQVVGFLICTGYGCLCGATYVIG